MYRHVYNTITKERFISPKTHPLVIPSISWISITDEKRIYSSEWSRDGTFIIEVCPSLSRQWVYFFNTNIDRSPDYPQYKKFVAHIIEISKSIFPRLDPSLDRNSPLFLHVRAWEEKLGLNFLF